MTEPFEKGIHKLKVPIGGVWEDDVVVDDEGRVVEGEERARILQKRRAQARERTEGLVVSASACFVAMVTWSPPPLVFCLGALPIRSDPHHL